MPSTKDLDEALIQASEMLVDCCSLISDIPFDSEEKNVYRLGKAISEINNVRSDLYAKNPDLKPEGWGEAPTDAQFQEWMKNATDLAEEDIRNGKYKEAIAVYESFLSIGPPQSMLSLVEAKIEKIRSEHGI